MTLVLAIRCREGIVLASDGQATTTDVAGQPTRQPVRKLFTLGRRIAWGAAGSLGLAQTLAAELARREDELLCTPDPRAMLARIAIPIQQRALRDFVALPGAEPPDLCCVFCWWDAGAGASILSLPRTGSDHQLHDDYAALGTGEIFAAFAMTSLGHLGTARLSLEQAKMVAYKAVSDAISVAAAFLGPPIQMAVVTPGDGATEVARDDLDGGLSDSVDAWKERQRESLGPLGPAPAERLGPSLIGAMRAMRESA